MTVGFSPGCPPRWTSPISQIFCCCVNFTAPSCDQGGNLGFCLHHRYECLHLLLNPLLSLCLPSFMELLQFALCFTRFLQLNDPSLPVGVMLKSKRVPR